MSQDHFSFNPALFIDSFFMSTQFRGGIIFLHMKMESMIAQGFHIVKER